jgi:hypothetical protein
LRQRAVSKFLLNPTQLEQSIQTKVDGGPQDIEMTLLSCITQTTFYNCTCIYRFVLQSFFGFKCIFSYLDLSFPHSTHLHSGPLLPCATMSTDGKPLSLSATLRDLALLRVSSGAALAATLPTEIRPTPDRTDVAVERSYEFVQQARQSIKIYSRGDVENSVGVAVEMVRVKVEELSQGLQDTR